MYARVEMKQLQVEKNQIIVTEHELLQVKKAFSGKIVACILFSFFVVVGVCEMISPR